MSLFKRKAVQRAPEFPAEEWEAVIRSSICTGEKVACMRRRDSGQLREIQLIRSAADLKEFCKNYGVSEETIRTVY